MRTMRMALCSLSVHLISMIAMYHVITSLMMVAGVSAASRCASSKTSPYVGFMGSLAELEHEVAGDVEIVDDCTAQVTMARYDGMGPAVYWWCATSSTPAGLRAGQRANDEQVTSAFNGFQTVKVELKKGLTWSNCTVFGLWCEIAKANFGNVELKTVKKANGTAVNATVGPRAKASGLPADIVESLMNCQELIPGKLNVYWKLDDPTKPSNVTMTLQGVAKDGEWMGFGFSDPTMTEASMIGSDVVIAGTIGGKPFAVDYYLTSREQCNYGDGAADGVCPDSGTPTDTRSNNVVVKASSVKDGIVMVTFTRPLVASDAKDQPWAVKSPAPAVFAMGPLSEQSNSSIPVVLFHGTARSEPTFKMNLGVESNSCPTPLGAASAANSSAAKNSSTPGNIIAPIIMHGRTTFNVALGPNPNYPNPPGWGVSYHINKFESPVLLVYRNVKYTFNVSAGPTHPLYITDDIIGGASKPDEKTFAGNEDSFGTASAPHVLNWTANATTPDTVYYQCYVHQKLGWKIEVVDDDNTTACSKTHPYVGFKGKLSELEHDVSGEVEVLDDCTFVVKQFRYDGAAPAVFFYGGKQDDRQSFVNGVRMSERIDRKREGEETVVRLPPGVSWDMYGAISVWCEQFKANFGSVQLKAGERSTTGDDSSKDCIVKTAAGAMTFDSCLSLSGSAPDYQVFYSLSKAANGNAMVKGAISAQVAGWVGFAFAQTPGRMVGANGVIVRNTGSGPKADQYHLAAQSVSGVQPPSKLKFTGITAMQEVTGRRLQQSSPVVTTFEVELEKTYEAAQTQGTPVIYAFGPVDSSGNLASHSLTAASSANLLLGEKTAGGSVAASSTGRAMNIRTLRSTHGVLVTVGWGILVPLGIAVAHSFKEWDPLWFYAHMIFQVAGFLLGLAGIAIGLWLGKESSGMQYKSHRILGIMVLVMGVLQVLVGVVRPGKSSAYRRAWELLHHWLGRVTTLLAIVNIYRGFDILDALGPETSSFKLAYSVVLGLIIAVAMGKHAYNYLQLPPSEAVPVAMSRKGILINDAANASDGEGERRSVATGNVH